MTAVHRLDDETRDLRKETDAEVSSLLHARSPDDYRRYLARTYGFVAPLERSLLDTPGLDRFTDMRRFRKHVLIEHDLQALGMRLLEIQSLPQCMWIPWFDDPHTALGWAYVLERNTLEHPALFLHLASSLPGEAAFASSYLKCYADDPSGAWRQLASGLERSISTPAHLDAIVDAARAAHRHFRRWKNTLDGKTLSDFQRSGATPRAG